MHQVGTCPKLQAARPRRRPRKAAGETERGFTLIEVVIAISILLGVMIPFADAFVSSLSGTRDSNMREVAVMLADTALDRARALDATDYGGDELLQGRGSTSVAAEWSAALPAGVNLSDTTMASDPNAAPTSGANAPLPTSPVTETIGTLSYTVYYYVGTCWEQGPGTGDSCLTTQAAGSYPMYRVIVAVTWDAPRGGCGSSGCSYVTSTLISGTANPQFNLNQTPQPPVITSGNGASFTVGLNGNFQVTATGSPTPTYSDAAFSGCTPSTLPSGVTFSNTGLLAGTPAPGTAGSYTLCITATNAAGSATQTFTLTVGLQATSMAITVNGSSSSATINKGSTASLAETGLPAGATGTVTFVSGATTLCTATLPTTSCLTAASLGAGTYNNITGSYSGDGTYAASASTNTVALVVTPNPNITSANNTTFTVGSPGKFQVTATGSPSPTFSDSAFSGCTPSSLPSGVTFSSSGLLSGTPATAGTFTLCVKATNSAGSATQTFTLTVGQQTPAVSVTGSLSGSTITFTATVAGGGVTPTGTVNWSIAVTRHGSATCPPSTLSSGVATCTVTGASSAHKYTATADYLGDSNYAANSGQSQGVTG